MMKIRSIMSFGYRTLKYLFPLNCYNAFVIVNTYVINYW